MSAWDKPSPDVAKILSAWQEWERGETAPGQVLSNMKRAGLGDLLASLSAEAATPAGA